MHFAIVASLLVLSSPITVLAAPPPNIVNATLVNVISTAVGTLRSSANPFFTHINSTIAVMNFKSTPAQKSAALKSVSNDVQGLTTAMNVAIAALNPVSILGIRDVEARELVTRQQNPVNGAVELVEFLIGDFIYGVTGVIKAFGSGNTQDILIALFAPFDYLLGYILLGELTDSGLLFSRSDYISRINQFDALKQQL